jgi:hypothetical protein
MHPAWRILLDNQEHFWGHLDYKALSYLRLVCKEMRSIIPERDAILGVFRHKPISTRLFRLLLLRLLDLATHAASPRP